MSKISELSDGGSLLPTDDLIVVRSGGNVRVKADTVNVDQIRLGDNEQIQLGNSQDLTLVHTSTQSIINQAGTGDLLIQKAGTTKLTVNSSGIDVTGSVTADGLVVDGASSGSTVATFTANANVDTPLLVFQRTGGAVAGKIGYDDTNTAITFGTTTNHEIRFLTNNTERMQLDASGNVGIGISPQSFTDLMVNTATNRNISIFDNAAGATICGLTDAGASAALRLAGSPLIFTGNGGSGAEAMRIDSSGKLLLGTGASGTTDLLQIESPASGGGYGIQIRRNDNNTDQTVGRIMMGNVVDSDLGMIAVKTDGASNNGAILFSTALSQTTSERMRIDSSGNVGIGVSAPTRRLVLGKGDSTGVQTQYTNSTTGAALGDGFTVGIDGSENAEFWNFENTNMLFATNGTERMRIDSSGNLLVGGTSTNPTGQNVAGAAIDATGEGNFSVDGAEALRLNRKQEGDIQKLMVAGATVGSIGVSGGNNLFISGQAANHAGLTFATDAILPTRQGSLTDNVTDLGASSERFKDFYLSGTANVGALYGKSTTGITKVAHSNANYITVADDAQITLVGSTTGACLIHAYDQGSGNGAVFFVTYTGNPVLLAGTSTYTNSDTDARFCVFKPSANSHTVIFKNRMGSSKNMAFLITGANIA